MSLPFFLPNIQVQEQGATEYMEKRRKNNEPRQFVAMGSYGVIYKNPSNPKEVIKILSPDTDINVEIEKADQMVQLTGDNRQSIQKIHITKNDVPYNALEHYRELNSLNTFMKNNQLIPALLMPNLGIDLNEYLIKKPFDLPENVYLEQCYKLLRQTSILFKHGVSHGDLRSENITFDGNEMTIIDFGIFGTFEKVKEVYEKGIHKHVVPSWAPPEFLILRHKVNETNGYINRLRERSPSYFSSISTDLGNIIRDSNDKNIEYIAKHNMKLVDLIPYLDNFGLGIALLEVLTVLYPYTNNLKILKTRKLLEKITHFEISKRMLPDQALIEMEKIRNMSGGRIRRIGKTRRVRKTRRTIKRV